LFWTVKLPFDALTISEDRRRAVLEAKDVSVIDSFTFLGPNEVPAEVSFRVRWVARGGRNRVGSGSSVAPTDPRAFLGFLFDARATGSFEGAGLGFRFRSEAGVSSDRAFAEMGFARNGSFLQ
jgi:hypothetical protein